ncbi:hypothetical protein JXL19_08310 [bacterium]|nr:hypothetical protein [bacterium]
MATIKHITLPELQKKLESLKLSSDTYLTVTIEEMKSKKKVFNKQDALDIMKKLKGSGNGNLINVLLKEREKDKLL